MGRECPVCEESTEREFELWERVDEEEMPPVDKAMSMAEPTMVTTETERMISLSCGHAFPLALFSEFEEKQAEHHDIEMFIGQVKNEPMLRMPDTVKDAIWSRKYDVDSELGRIADKCKENVVEKPKVSP